MSGLIKYKNYVIDLKQLPEDLRERVQKYAVLDILKDQAKDEIKADNINLQDYIDLWLKNKRPATQISYEIAIRNYITWCNLQGLNPILTKAEDADKYVYHLKDTEIKSNSIRLKIAALSSLYTTLKRYRIITVNPFHGAILPKKEYKKAVKPDQERTIPVMNQKEYKAIIKTLEEQAQIPGNRQFQILKREAALKLLPAVKVMAMYGLRVGAISTIEKQGLYFSYTTKGGKSYKANIIPGTLPLKKKPFAEYKIITMQLGLKRITKELHGQGKIRYPYTCHDLRHYFASQYYLKTKDLVGLKNLLNHASLNITDIYLQSIVMQKTK